LHFSIFPEMIKSLFKDQSHQAGLLRDERHDSETAGKPEFSGG